MQTDWLTLLNALLVHVPLDHLLNGKLLSKFYDVSERKFRKPIAVIHYFCFAEIKYLTGLLFIRMKICFDLFLSQWLSHGVLVGRITDKRSKTANQKNHFMSGILKIPQLPQRNSISYMDICRSRIKT